jgi:hypothetical protein
MLWVVEMLRNQPHLKSKVQSGDSDSVSNEEGQEEAPGTSSIGKHAFGDPSSGQEIYCSC